MSDLSERPGAGVLERARRHADFSVHELWLAYVGLGGRGAPADVGSYLSSRVTPEPREYNILALALNERFDDLGLDSPVLYTAS